MIRLIILFQTFFFMFFLTEKVDENHEITICNTTHHEEISSEFLTTYQAQPNSGFETDSTKTYSMPYLSNTPNGETLLSWTEKDATGLSSFCIAFSKDNGQTFSEKKTIFTGAGIGNSRMMRAKVLAKKDGNLVAVFTNRADNQGGKGGRAANLVYCVSTDKGNNWTAPVSVDTDPKQGIMRGFFDAILMPNDEIAITYLKDVANSTKHEERDLRLVVSKNGVMQPEKLIDAVVCDCCPVNMVIEENGALSIIYRDNNDDIRDIAKMTSTDNAYSFSKSEIVYNDGWKIQGCPHSGAISTASGYKSWYSGENKESGIRLVAKNGKKLFVLDNAAKNQYLVDSKNSTVILWEQNSTESNVSSIAYRKIMGEKYSETKWIEGTTNATNVVSIGVNNKLLVAYEVKLANKRNTITLKTIDI
jgi:hypothetical protein